MFDHIHIFFPNYPQIHPLQPHVPTHPNRSDLLLFSNTLNTSEYKLCCPPSLGSGVWGMVDMEPGSTSLKKIDSPNSYHMPIALQLVVGFPAISPLHNLHTRILFDLSLHRSWVHCLNCWAFLDAMLYCAGKHHFL